MGLFSWEEHRLPNKKSGDVEGYVSYICPPGARPFYSVAIGSISVGADGAKFRRANFRSEDLDDVLVVVEACKKTIARHKRRLANERL